MKTDMQQERSVWLSHMLRVAEPVLVALAKRELKLRMPADYSKEYAHLEALGRTLCGIAPWLECVGLDGDEEQLRQRMAELAREAIDAATDPDSPDLVNFTTGMQPIVDAAFLSHALVRAPRELQQSLPERVQRNLCGCLAATRTRKPFCNNWLLFSAMIEVALRQMGQEWDPMRVDYALKQHTQWYHGDGIFGDGPEFHWDYYNSFVIQPMLADILHGVGEHAPDWLALKEPITAIGRRYAAVLERLISPDGSFPPLGRSLTYRCGAFQLLAQSALQKNLPDDLPPPQVRCALGAVIRRTLSAPETFTAEGWLRPGLHGYQPGLAEVYISTGSLYLCSTAFLPMGLPPANEFWIGEPADWTQVKIWSGENKDADHAFTGMAFR